MDDQIVKKKKKEKGIGDYFSEAFDNAAAAGQLGDYADTIGAAQKRIEERKKKKLFEPEEE